MRRKYNLRKIVTKRSYSTEELAERLGVHIQTVRDWNRAGMNPLPGSKSPYLFLGSEVKTFLIKEKQKYKVKLKEDEIYCTSCRKAVRPDPETIVVEERKQKLGGGNKSIYLKSKCPKCSHSIVRFSSEDQLAKRNIASKTSREPPQPEPIKQVSKKQNAQSDHKSQTNFLDNLNFKENNHGHNTHFAD